MHISPSKQEVEVAETLYDIARIFVNQARPNETIHEVKSDPKLEWKPEGKLEPTTTTSLLPASNASSPLSTQTLVHSRGVILMLIPVTIESAL